MSGQILILRYSDDSQQLGLSHAFRSIYIFITSDTFLQIPENSGNHTNPCLTFNGLEFIPLKNT